MMPRLLVGDRLVVSKYPYGWSYVSPSFHVLSPIKGRLLGRLPERGDIVIVTHRGKSSDYIKRVIGLPGDTIEIRDGQVILHGVPVKQETRPELHQLGREACRERVCKYVSISAAAVYLKKKRILEKKKHKRH